MMPTSIFGSYGGLFSSFQGQQQQNTLSASLDATLQENNQILQIPQPLDFNYPQDNTSSVLTMDWATKDNEKYIAAGCWDGQLIIYQQQDTKNLLNKTSINLEDPILSCKWSLDGRSVLCARNRQIILVDVESGQIIRSFKKPSTVNGIHLICDFPNFQGFISTSSYGQFWFWNLDQVLPIRRFNNDLNIICSDAKKKKLILALQNNEIRQYNFDEIFTTDSINVNKIKHPFENEDPIQSISLFPEADGFGIGSVGGRAHISKLINTGTGSFSCNSVMTWKAHQEEKEAFIGGPKITTMYPINAIGFNSLSDGFVYTAGSDGKINFWDFQKNV